MDIPFGASVVTGIELAHLTRMSGKLIRCAVTVMPYKLAWLYEKIKSGLEVQAYNLQVLIC